MASLYPRSSRRSEGLTTRSSARTNVAVPHARHQQSNIGRKKRPYDSISSGGEHAFKPKRARIAVEIPIPSNLPPPPQRDAKSLVINNSNAGPDVAPGVPVLARSTSSPKHAETATPAAAPPAPSPPRKPAVHHQKVANGIRHELDRLQPNAADLKAERRQLRSQEGSRFKSELSAYFPEYDEVIGNEPKEAHILNLDTPMIIVDSAKTSTKNPPSQGTSNAEIDDYPLAEFPASLLDDLHNAQRIDISSLGKNYKERDGEDPLPDAYFELIHRKPERQEKAIRNSDKGRAQHEKDQVIRLLEGLQGHDWLKLMGVSGITDSKKKEYEPAREYFIKGCEAILDKFRAWKEEEKRRKLERELALAEVEEDDGDPEDEMEYVQEDEDAQSDGDPPDYSDVDASAARQLHDEAIACSAPPRHTERRAKAEVAPPAPAAAKEPEKEFTSFFSKPYLRAAALGKHRRSGRSVSAWGHAVPEVPQQDFDLPEEYRDEEVLKVQARRKRRDRRISKA